jgi:hypothetical protein
MSRLAHLRIRRLVLSLLCATAVLAMHGVSAHPPGLTALSSTSPHSHELHGEPVGGAAATAAGTDDHHEGNRDHCSACGHDVAAAMCAFIVAVLLWRAESLRRLRLVVQRSVSPLVRLWSPDPPVPKVRFVIA